MDGDGRRWMDGEDGWIDGSMDAIVHACMELGRYIYMKWRWMDG
jgi:hypothetical protein